jgi:DNA-binding MarR family transcriptional regulator
MLRRKLTERIDRYEITAAQWSVLRDLSSQEELPADMRQVAPAQLAARLEQDRPTLSGILERLRQKGLVLMEANPKDRRSQLIRLTEQAHAVIPALEEESRQVLQLALSGFAGKERELLGTLLLRMIGSLDKGECTDEQREPGV